MQQQKMFEGSEFMSCTWEANQNILIPPVPTFWVKVTEVFSVISFTLINLPKCQ